MRTKAEAENENAFARIDKFDCCAISESFANFWPKNVLSTSDFVPTALVPSISIDARVYRPHTDGEPRP